MKVGNHGAPHAGACGAPQAAKAKGGSGEKAKIGGSGEKKMPPGQAKKDCGCGMPPGIAKKFSDGFDPQNAQGDQGNRVGTLPQQDQRSGGGLLSNLLGGLFGGWGNNNYNFGDSTPQSVAQKNATPTLPPADPSTVDPATQAVKDANAKQLTPISQMDPAGAKDGTYTNAAMNCGPTVLAMIGKANGLEPAGMTDAAYINQLGTEASTTAKGTTGNGMIAALNDMGFQTAANKGGDLNWINNQLAAGHDVIANGDYYSLPGHTDPNLVAGHYVAVTGVNGGMYTVDDPANGTQLQLSAQQLSDFIAHHPEGGFTLATWPDAAG
jgi:peptidase C39-like protein